LSPLYAPAGWRLPFRGAAIVAFALVLAACGGSTAPTTTTDASTATTTSTAAGTTSSGAATATPEQVLLQGLIAVGERFAFTATVSIDGAVTTSVDGRVTNGTGHYEVTSGGTVVEYIIGPAGQWARQGDGDWTVLGGAAPLVDPLSSLASPSSVSIVSDTGGETVLDAIYSATDLGFADSGDVLVTLTLRDGVLAGTRYVAAVGTQPATVETTFDTTGDIPDVTIP